MRTLRKSRREGEGVEGDQGKEGFMNVDALTGTPGKPSERGKKNPPDHFLQKEVLSDNHTKAIDHGEQKRVKHDHWLSKQR